MKKSLFFLISLIFTLSGYSQSTYYWVGGVASANWNTAASWNTALNGSGSTRATPNVADILIFDGSNLGGATPVTGAAIVNNVSTETIASLRLLNGANITFMNSSPSPATLTGNWARAAAVAVNVSSTASSNVLGCTNTTGVRVGAIISSGSVVPTFISVVTSVTPNVSFTTSLPATTTNPVGSEVSINVCQPTTFSGDGSILNVGDAVYTGTQSNFDQIITKIDNNNFFTIGTVNPQTAITSVATLKKAVPLTLTDATNAFAVSANSSLTIDNPLTSRPMIIALAPGAKGTVDGLIELDLAANTFNTGRIFVAPTGGAQLSFKSGSTFKSGQLQFPFGAIANSDNNNVVFEAGSQAWYGLAAGTPVNCIFGATYPASVVKFEKGSTFVHNGGTDRLTGYTFREFPIVTTNVNNLTLLQLAVAESINIPAGFTVTQSAGNTIGLKGNFNNNGTFAFGSAANGMILNFVGDGTTPQDFDLNGSGGTGTVTYNGTTPDLGGSFQRIIVGSGATVNLQPGLEKRTYGQTQVWGTLNFGNEVINNTGLGITALNVRASNASSGTALSLYATNKANTLILDNTTNFNTGMLISGTGIPANTYIVTSSAGNYILLSNSASVPAGTTITSSANPSSATLITSNTSGLPASYPLTGGNTYSLPTGSPGVNYRFDAATTTPFFSADTTQSRNLTLAANVTSNIKRLHVHNTLNLGSNTLTIPVNDTVRITSGNAVAGTSSTKYVVTESSPVTGAKGVFSIANVDAATLFPIGTASSYLPVTITPNTTDEDYYINVFTGITTDATPNGTPMLAGDKAKVVDAVWTINNNFTPTGNSNIRLEWPTGLEGSTFTGYANNQIGIMTNSGAWLEGGGTCDNTANNINNSFMTFGSFGVGATSSILPLRFGTVTVMPLLNNQCRISWGVFSEAGITRYMIEGSENGVQFTEKGSVPANGSSQYSFTDLSRFAGVNFYRIKAVDLDGTTTYSSIVKLNPKLAGSVNVYPNPVVNGTINLFLTSATTQNYVVELHDVIGRKLFVNKLKHNAGTGFYPLSLPAGIKPGIYSISIFSNDGTTFVKSIAVN